MEENPRSPGRYQFTIRGLLWATFWLAVSMAAWTFALGRMYDRHQQDGTVFAIVLVLFIGILAPPAAVGSVGGMKLGALALGGMMAIYIIWIGLFLLTRR